MNYCPALSSLKQNENGIVEVECCVGLFSFFYANKK